MPTADPSAFKTAMLGQKARGRLGDDLRGKDALLATLCTNARAFPAGHQLTIEGDEAAPVLCVIDGWLIQSKSLADGQTLIIDFVLPGDIVSVAAADGATAASQVDALTDVVVATLGTAQWDGMKRDWPALDGLAVRLAAASRARISERMLRLAKGSAPTRIAYALMEMWLRLQAIGRAPAHGFHLPLTQQHLGDFTGLSSVHVCRTMRRLAHDGIIRVENHMDIGIRDLAALARIAGIDPEELSREIAPAPAA